MMQNRRRHKRFKVKDMEIIGKMAFAKEVNVIDISAGGISIKTDKRLNVGSEYSLRIKDNDKEIAVKGAVTWALLSEIRKDNLGNSTPMYTAGIKFADFSGLKTTEIINFIDKHKRENEYGQRDSRYYIRFDIDPANKTILNFHNKYEVKVLSLGGMLIESSDALEPENILQMEIFLSDDKSINFLGKVISCHLTVGENPKKYDIGIEFIDMSEEDKEKLKEFIQNIENSNEAGIIPDKILENIKKDETEEETEVEHRDAEKTREVLEVKLAEAERRLGLQKNDLSIAAQEKDRLMVLIKEEQRKAEEIKEEIAVIEERASALSVEKEELRARLVELEVKARSIEEEFSKTKDERDTLRSLLEEEKGRTEELQERVGKLEAEEAELQSFWLSTMEEHQKKLKATESFLRILQDRGIKPDEDSQRLKGEKAQLETERDELRDNTKLYEEMIEEERRNTAKIKEILETKLSEMEKRIQISEKNLLEVTEDRDKHRFLLEQEQARILESEKNVEEQRKKQQEAENSIRQLGEEKEILIAEIEKLKSERDSSKEKLKQYEEETEAERRDTEKIREVLKAKLADAERRSGLQEESEIHLDNKEASLKETKRSIRPRFLFIALSSFILLLVVCLFLIYYPFVPKKQNTIHQPLLSKQESPLEVKQDRHTIELIAKDKTWVLIKIDDSKLKETILQPGERLQMNANNNFSLKIGNAGGIKIIFDGKDIGNLGDKGQVVNLKLPPSKK